MSFNPPWDSKSLWHGLEPTATNCLADPSQSPALYGYTIRPSLDSLQRSALCKRLSISLFVICPFLRLVSFFLKNKKIKKWINLLQSTLEGRDRQSEFEAISMNGQRMSEAPWRSQATVQTHTHTHTHARARTHARTPHTHTKWGHEEKIIYHSLKELSARASEETQNNFIERKAAQADWSLREWHLPRLKVIRGNMSAKLITSKVDTFTASFVIFDFFCTIKRSILAVHIFSLFQKVK